MPVGIIDLFKMVYIQNRKCDRSMFLLRFYKGFLKSCIAATAVEQSCERIVRLIIFSLCKSLLERRNFCSELCDFFLLGRGWLLSGFGFCDCDFCKRCIELLCCSGTSARNPNESRARSLISPDRRLWLLSASCELSHKRRKKKQIPLLYHKIVQKTNALAFVFSALLQIYFLVTFCHSISSGVSRPNIDTSTLISPVSVSIVCTTPVFPANGPSFISTTAPVSKGMI